MGNVDKTMRQEQNTHHRVNRHCSYYYSEATKYPKTMYSSIFTHHHMALITMFPRSPAADLRLKALKPAAATQETVF